MFRSAKSETVRWRYSAQDPAGPHACAISIAASSRGIFSVSGDCFALAQKVSARRGPAGVLTETHRTMSQTSAYRISRARRVRRSCRFVERGSLRMRPEQLPPGRSASMRPGASDVALSRSILNENARCHPYATASSLAATSNPGFHIRDP